MSDLLEKRVSELETLVWEIPNLLNVRFGRFETEVASLRGAIVDNTSRLAAMERAMTMVQTDMRDLRGGVTRQLVAQDARIAELGQQVTELTSEVGVIRTEVGGVRAEVGGVGAEVGSIRTEVGGVRAEVGSIRTEVGGVRAEVGSIRTEVGGVRSNVETLISDVGEIKGTLAEILHRIPR